MISVGLAIFLGNAKQEYPGKSLNILSLTDSHWLLIADGQEEIIRIL